MESLPLPNFGAHYRTKTEIERLVRIKMKAHIYSRHLCSSYMYGDIISGRKKRKQFRISQNNSCLL